VKLNIAMIKDVRGGSLPFDFTVEGEALQTEDAEQMNFAAPLVLHGKVTNNGQSLSVEGVLKTVLQLKCGCCLEPFLLALEEEFCEKFVEGEAETGDMAHNENEPSYFQGDIISFEELAHDLLVLALPMRPICREDCRGLCVKCGKNLNHQVCSCYDDDLDPRLSALKQLLDKE